jgi:hypothetical protein
MTQVFKCPHGHQWPAPAEAVPGNAPSSLPCPVCGAPGQSSVSLDTSTGASSVRDELPPPPRPVTGASGAGTYGSGPASTGL